MRHCISLFAALLIFAVGLPTAHAGPIYADNFDSYADQAAFNAPGAWPALAPQPTGTLSTEQFVSFPNSVKIEAPVAGGTPTAQRNQHIFPESGTVLAQPTGRLVWSYDFYDVAPTAAPFRQYMNLQDSTAAGAANQLISIGLNNNQTAANSGGNYYMARILGYTVPTTADPDGGPNESVGGAGIYFKLNDFGVGLRSLGWHNLKVELSSDDGIATDYAFYVDGLLAEKVSNIGGAGTLRSYDVLRIGAGVSSAQNAYFDNVVVTIPEPATFALGGLGLLGIIAAGRRRAR